MKKDISDILKEYSSLWGEETPGEPYETVRSPEPDTAETAEVPAVTPVEKAYCSGNAAYWDAYSEDACPFTQSNMIQAWKRGFRAGEAEDAELDRQNPKLRNLLLPPAGYGVRQQPDGSWLFWGRIDETNRLNDPSNTDDCQ